MNILTSLKKAYSVYKYERGANYELGRSLSSTGVSNLFGTGGSDIDVLKEYSGYVWKCVNVRSEDLAAQNFYVERSVGDKWQKDNNHPFNVVLEGVDGGYDLSELIEAHQVCMDMYGESFWYFSKGESSNKPFAVYLLDPAYVTVIVAGERVAGYIYQKDGDRVAMDLDEVAHFRLHNPANRFRGAGPMQKAGWFIRSSRYVTTYINNFLENNAIPAGVIVAKGQVNDKDWELFKKQWQERYAGVDSAGKTGYIRGQDLDFVKTGLSLGEVDFEKVKNSSRDDILAMFSMPKSKLGLYEDFNRASATVSEQQFAKTFTKQAVTRITRRLSRKVGMWYGEQYRIGSDFRVPEDREQKLAETDKGVGRWITVNEAREEYGYDRLPDKAYDTIQVEVKGTPETQPAKSLGKIRIKTVNKSEFSYEMKESFRAQTEDLQVKYEQQFFQKAHPVLKAQKQMVLGQLQPKKIVDSNFDTETEAKKLQEEVIPLFIALAAEQGQHAAEFVGNADTTFVLTDVTRKYIEDSIAKAVLGFTKDTQTKIAQALADGLNNGDSIADISKAISKIYDDVLGVKTPGYRIERLARTEVIKTSNEITEAAYKQTGLVQKKEWFTNPGACEFCLSLKGSIIHLGGTFVPKGARLTGVDGGTRINEYEDVNHPPVHPACRCALIPVID